MTVSTSTLGRAAGIAAATAGLLFVLVQINHPPMEVASVTTTEWVVRSTAKALMAALALGGITGMYLRQFRQVGVLGLMGYLLFSLGYFVMFGVEFVAAFVLPTVADTMPGYVNDVVVAAAGGTPAGDIGLMQAVFVATAAGYVGGGLVFGIALFRARVLARWAAVLLAVGSLVTVLLAVMPDAFYRFLAFPNAIAMIALGYSLWRSVRTDTAPLPAPVDDSRVVTQAGA